MGHLPIDVQLQVRGPALVHLPASSLAFSLDEAYQHRGTLLEDSVQRSWTATFFRIFVFFLYPEKYGGSKTVLKSEIGLVDHIQKK